MTHQDSEHFLENFVVSSPAVQPSFLQALAAMACDDGAVSLAEYGALIDVAQQLDGSNLSAYTALHAMETPADLGVSLERLTQQAATLGQAQRLQLLDLAMPVIDCQGEKALQHAQALAKALDLRLDDTLVQSLQARGERPWWKTVTVHAARNILGREDIQRARECIRLTGSDTLSRALVEYLEGRLDREVLVGEIEQAHHGLEAQVDAFRRDVAARQENRELREALLLSAQGLQSQIEQRLQLVRARIEHEKQDFLDGFEDLIHDAGNAFEVEAKSLMRVSDMSRPTTWQHLGKSAFGRELERRIDRAGARYGDRLRLLKQEVSIFANDYGYARARLLESFHHKQLAAAMPGLRLMTRVKNAAETAAGVSLGGGLLASAGIGAASYLLGAAIVLPVVAPAVPFIGGAIVVGGLLKWLMDRVTRTDEEVDHKRGKLEQELRGKLQEMKASYFQQLDQAQSEFEQTARAIMEPILLEAHAQARLLELQSRVVQRLLGHASTGLKR